MSSSGLPLDEDMATLWLDRTNFVGAVLGGVAYGIHAVVAFSCVRGLITQSSFASRKTWVILGLIGLLFTMGTLNFAGNTAISQKMFVDNRGYPGGPTVYLVEHYDAAPNQMGNAAYIVANFFTDATLLYRTFVVWNKSYVILALPFLLFLASTTMSIFVMYQISAPTASLWTTSSVNFTLSYFSMSIALNVLLTIMISARLFMLSRQVRDAIGKDHAKPFISLAAIAIESAAPYALCGLIFIITFAKNNAAQNVMLPILSQVMCLSPELIICRVGTNQAWSAGLMDKTSGIGLRDLGFHSGGAQFTTNAEQTEGHAGDSDSKISVNREGS